MTKDQLKKFIVKLEEENKKLKEEIQRLEFDVDAWHQLKLLLEWEIEKLTEENKKLEDEVKDLVERNIELDKKYMLVLTENKKLREKLNKAWLEEYWFFNEY